MINTIPKYIDKFINWMNVEEDDVPDEPVSLTILYGYDAIGCNDDQAFGAYNTDTKSIMIADPEVMANTLGLSNQDKIDTTLTNIAHEYFHHLQFVKYGAKNDDVTNHSCNEDDAEAYARKVVNRYYESINM